MKCSVEIEVRSGIRQGDVLPPFLFNVYRVAQKSEPLPNDKKSY